MRQALNTGLLIKAFLLISSFFSVFVHSVSLFSSYDESQKAKCSLMPSVDLMREHDLPSVCVLYVLCLCWCVSVHVCASASHGFEKKLILI